MLQVIKWVNMITNFFTPVNAKSRNLDSYSTGTIPFVSNSNLNNGVVKYVDSDVKNEIVEAPCIAVNGFGYATVQLKPFVGAGNGGVHVIALIPKKEMSVLELAYYASQINLQSWRFSYGRRAIKKRLNQIKLQEFDLSVADSSAFKELFDKRIKESVSQLFSK